METSCHKGHGGNALKHGRTALALAGFKDCFFVEVFYFVFFPGVANDFQFDLII